MCALPSEMTQCFSHSECSSGLRCVNGYCGQEQYFQAIANMTCSQDSVCEVSSQ